MTAARDESVVAGEGKKARVEAHEIAFMLGDSGRKIIEPEFTRATLQCIEEWMWQRTNVSKLWLCVNSRYNFRLWHSTWQNAYSLRGVPLYSSPPKCPSRY